MSGSEEQARRDAAAAITMHQRCGARMLAEWPITILGFLEVSLGNYEAALTTLQPLLSRYAEGQFGMEIHVAAFVPDAVEAMVHLGRLTRPSRWSRRWNAMAVGSTGPGCWPSARAAAACCWPPAATSTRRCLAVAAAMAEHDRLPMPFERARTQLLLGQLQRRQRRKDAAHGTLREALRAFEELGTPLWADRARAELARTEVATADGRADAVRTAGRRTRRRRA